MESLERRTALFLSSLSNVKPGGLGQHYLLA
jgi:hypothetical protein